MCGIGKWHPRHNMWLGVVLGTNRNHVCTTNEPDRTAAHPASFPSDCRRRCRTPSLVLASSPVLSPAAPSAVAASCPDCVTSLLMLLNAASSLPFRNDAPCELCALAALAALHPCAVLWVRTASCTCCRRLLLCVALPAGSAHIISEFLPRRCRVCKHWTSGVCKTIKKLHIMDLSKGIHTFIPSLPHHHQENQKGLTRGLASGLQ